MLEPTVADLRDDLQSCEKEAEDIGSHFSLMKNIAEELSAAIGNQISIV